jgi:hypothetical protein
MGIDRVSKQQTTTTNVPIDLQGCAKLITVVSTLLLELHAAREWRENGSKDPIPGMGATCGR